MFESDFFWMFHGFFSLLFYIFLVIFLFILIRKLANSDHKSYKKDEAIEILKKRYANGEINKEEFEQIKKDLKE
jgi:putative membrane protein